MFIHVTQDGIGRFSKDKSPEEIEGLYTDDLEICVAVLVIGDKNISLIHDTGKIHLQGEGSLENEFKFCEAKKVVVCYNKSLLYDKDRGNIIFGHMRRIKELISSHNHIEFTAKGLEKITGKNADNMGLCSAFITRTGEIHDGALNIDQYQTAGETTTGILIRKKLNETNNTFLNRGTHETMQADLQFDGKNFIPHKGLYKTTGQVVALINQQEPDRFKKNISYLQSFALLFLIFSKNKQDEYYGNPINLRDQWSNEFIAKPEYKNHPLVKILYETIASTHVEQIMKRALKN